VLGSNLFNASLCLGVAALARPIVVPMASFGIDLVALVVVTALLAWSIRRPRSMARVEGSLALVAYAAIVVLAVLRGQAATATTSPSWSSASWSSASWSPAGRTRRIRSWPKRSAQ
jgi:hypothetical protein